MASVTLMQTSSLRESAQFSSSLPPLPCSPPLPVTMLLIYYVLAKFTVFSQGEILPVSGPSSPSGCPQLCWTCPFSSTTALCPYSVIFFIPAWLYFSLSGLSPVIICIFLLTFSFHTFHKLGDFFFFVLWAAVFPL